MNINPPVPYCEAEPYTEILAAQGGVGLPPEQPQSASRYLSLLWCWRRRFLIAFSAVALLGGMVLVVSPLKYTARALIVVGSREPSPLLVDRSTTERHSATLDIDGEIQLITSPLSLRKVTQELGLPHRPQFRRNAEEAGPGAILRLREAIFGGGGKPGSSDAVDIIANALRRNLKVDRIGTSSLIGIEFSAADPNLAAEIANAVARNNAVDDEFRRGLTLAERAGFDLPKAWVASPATVPLVPSAPNVKLIVVITVALGLTAGVAAVLLSDHYVSQRVLSADQISRQGVRPLALIPDFGEASYRQAAVTMASEQPAIFVDSIAALHASLLPFVPRTPPACLVLLFTSALPFEGKSTTVAALASSVARGGGRVLVIDADLRSPSLHQAFGAPPLRGLSNCLDADIDLNTLIRVDPATGVSLLPAGAQHSRPFDILNSARLHQAIQRWRHSFDFILIDAAPVLPVADARLLAPSTDYCVFVARWGKTSWEVINRGLRVMVEAGARVAGVAVSRVDVKQMEGYGLAASAFYGRSGRQYGGDGVGEA